MIKDLLPSGVLAETLQRLRREFVWVGVFSLIVNLLMLTPTIYMLQIYDRIMISQNELTLLFLTMIVMGFFIMMAFAEWLRSRLLVRTGMKLDRELNSRVFNASFSHWLSQKQTNPTEAFSDLTNLRQFITGVGIIALFDMPWAPLYIAVIFILHPLLGLLAIAFCLIQLVMTYLGYRMTNVPIENSAQAELKSRGFLYAKLKNAESIEAMGMLGNLRQRWLSYHQDHQAKLADASMSQHRQQAYAKFVRYSIQSLTLAAGAMLVIEGQLSAGAMIAANVLMTRALFPLDQIVGSWRSFMSAKTSYIRLEGLLRDDPIALASAQDAVPRGEVKVNGLCALTPKGGVQILQGIDATFEPGTVTAIIGPSGSGKTTLARCLVGIWPLTTGQVLFDGVPIERLDHEWLGDHIGYLPQDIELFDGSIADNIARFRELQSEKVIEAAKHAGIHDMILRLPQGYDTPIGENGNILSAGQRQRLGLARAIFDNPALIVLDEPNANLDEIGELALIKAIQHLKAEGKTIVLITHRRNILAHVDQLAVLNAGRLVHFGRRDEVIEAMNGPAASVKPSAASSQLAY